jgi:EmrB/QacA subfamily drug resistance transporter
MKNHQDDIVSPEAQDSNPSQLIETKSNKWLVLIAIGIGTFMTALDGSVVNTILPVLGKDFSSSVASIEWVVTVYLLVLSGLLLSFGRLGDMRGHKRVYVAGFAIFIISSAICGLATSIMILVVFRAIQSIGAAMLQANSPAILTTSFPGRQRGQALGLQATMTYIGLTVGPSLGGWLADQFSWRAVFYINVPVGITAMLLSIRFIFSDKRTKKSEKFDFVGAGIFILGLVLLLVGLNQGHALGWLSGPILISISLAIVLLVIFIQVEKRNERPMLDLKLFSSPDFSASVISSILNYICVYSIVFLMPFYLIQGMNFSPTKAGIILTAMPIVMAIIAPISGSLSDRFGTRIPVAVGMTALGIGLFVLTGLQADSSPAEIALRLAVAGFGIGTFISPNTSALMGSAPRQRQGIASGILATSRNVGMVLGVGFAGAVFTTALGTISNPSREVVVQAIQTSFLIAAIIAVIGVIIAVFHPSENQLADQ